MFASSVLSSAYKELGKWKEAEDILQLIREKVDSDLPSDHPRRYDVRHQLAMLYSKTGRYSEAEELYKQALVGLERVYGENNGVVLNCRASYGTLLLEMGRIDEAEVVYHKALQNSKGRSLDRWDFLVVTRCNLATILVSQKKKDRSRGTVSRSQNWLS